MSGPIDGGTGAAEATRNASSAAQRLRPERWVLPAIVALSLCATLGAFWTSLDSAEARRTAHFERETTRVGNALLGRMERYEDALQAGVAALDARAGRMDRATWRRFADGLDLTRRYPGVHGIGLVARATPDELGPLVERMRADGAPEFTAHPRVDGDVHFPIVHIEPEAANRAAIGLDLAHETNRREGAEAALATGLPRITGPIVLVQDESRAPGFLFYTPYPGTERWPDDAQAFDALVYSPFVVDELIGGALGTGDRQVEVRIRDAGITIHDEFVARAADPDAPATTLTLPMYGREWSVDMRAGEHFAVPSRHLQPFQVLGLGLLLDAMVIGLFLSIARTQRALRRSARMGEELAERTRELEDSNRELERFACVVSHDLKTPLRGIGDLAWYLEEDLEPLVESGQTHPDVPRHIERIGVQTRRMDALIDGILDYSGIGQGKHKIEPVAVAELVDELVETHATHPGRILVESGLPVLETSRTRLEQVLGNLVSNAFKYHDDPERACVRLSFEPRGPSWRIRVTDNGPGIDPRYHERIFEIFQTLQPKDAVDSTGVGLAIVRRTAEHMGGSVRVESVPGHGATFVVDWPARTLDTDDTIRNDPALQTERASDDNGGHDADLRRAA